ncbi:MAG: Antilisterial bacteriocin subtilosin biosynthesis protein AlbA [Syntrophorhabdus sp. PtaB.Bin047]|nr:MAG: Antilisterial bacteriocin subtilosin biosynthesis protein AlbA [Syntrophorhabdus sp. PtaB.Bin047]
MANILLATRCNRSCPYCFASSEMAGSSRERFISWENLTYIADLLEAGGERSVSLLGGEPTLHPRCVDIILYLLRRGFTVTVFTNGVLSPKRLGEFRRYLTRTSPDRLSFVCNLNDPIQTPAPTEEIRRIERFLAVMGPFTLPGFNIYRLDFTLDFLFDLINRFGMKRHMRLGITHPLPGRRDGFIRPSEMRAAIERLCSYRPLFDSLKVSPGIDCGFPLCKFTEEELGWLHHFNRPLQFRCAPGLDITPDMSVYHCFPLSRYRRRSLFEFDSIREVREYYQDIHDEIKAEVAGIFDECDGCRHKEEGVCGGGGLCQAVHRLVIEAPVRGKDMENELARYDLSS